MQTCVLVVDDDPEFAAGLRENLEAAGFATLSAPDGETALEILQRDGAAVRAAVVDLDLPSMSGFDLIREMTSKFPQVRVMAVTGIYKALYLDIARNVGARMARRKTNNGVPPSAEEWQNLVKELLQ